jgi:small ligand-binding sensory domain FIST
MKRFLHAHAMHPDWRVALAQAHSHLQAQLDAQDHPGTPSLGWLYLTDHYASDAEALLADVRSRWPGVTWIGAVGVGIAASGVEYFDEPALALMLADLAPAQFRVFSGARPLAALAAGFEPASAQIHADPATTDLAELIAEMADRTSSRYVFGGLASARNRTLHIAGDVLEGGLSGVAFTRDVALVSRVTQGCQPVGPVRRITAAERNVITTLDGEPALDCVLRDLGVPASEPRRALSALRQTLVGLSEGDTHVLERTGQFGTDTLVRHLIGIDPQRRGIAIGDVAAPGMQLAFCQRNTEAARRDLVRICAEIREELEPETLPLAEARALARGGIDAPAAAGVSQRIAGAVYVSCAGRGGPHFGAPSAELAIVRQALGDVPLVGFFAAGEVAHHHLYGYTGVLTAFAAQ